MTHHPNDLPIGVFDSGLGGLTVAREIRRRLPSERILYLGDNARVPYGTRSPKTIERYARNCSEFLLRQGLKMLVVACNTVSAVALPAIRELTAIPVLGVISAGARAVAVTGSPRIGIIGTIGTVRSNAYPQKIAAINAECKVFQRATPLFVPLAEEGWLTGEVPEAVAMTYLKPLVSEGIEVLLLGCTHYPLLADTIRKTLQKLGSHALVVDSATAMAADVTRLLKESGLSAPDGKEGELTCFVTDLPTSFETMAAQFLGEKLREIKQIDLS